MCELPETERIEVEAGGLVRCWERLGAAAELWDAWVVAAEARIGLVGA